MIAPGDTLANRFELRRRIGSGGMGEVYEAYDRDTAEVIALKTLARADGETVTRFKREFRSLQSTAHPNLVNLRELVRDGDQWFLTMELVKGQHFLEHVRGDLGKLRAALRQLVVGLRVLHESGLIHRDIKPSNVMVNDDGRVVLLDFGLVTAMDPTRQSTEGRATGTVEYMAPEQAVGSSLTEAADWYAVGVMLYEALTGDVPHTGDPMRIMITKQHTQPRPVAEVAPSAPADLGTLCQDLLAIEPERRLSGAEIARRLGIAEGSGDRSTPPVTRGSGRRVFIGRERELAELAESFESSRQRPTVHLVIGESGIGKSELVTRFTRRFHEDDPTSLILSGRCYERESVPYKAFDGVADGIAQHLAHLPASEVAPLLPETPALLVRLFPVFLRLDAIASVPAPRNVAVEPQEQRRRMFDALRQLLGAITMTRQVVITIDDLQWADADSFLLLRELLRGPLAPKVLVLATVRNVFDADTMSLDEMLEQLSEFTVRKTSLGPLSDDESRALAEQLAPSLIDQLDVDRVTREARGHPMFLHEILRHLDNLGDGTRTASLDDALTSRVALLGDDARGLLELVCIAGAPISLEVATSACRLDPTTLSRAIASLRVATLAREVQRTRGLALEPYHDRVRESVSGRIPEPKRRDLHARLAIALESSGEHGNPQLLLRHFRLAELPERAARYAEEAAARSFEAHAFDQAARLWKTALDLDPGEGDRRRLLLKLGEALIAAGRGVQAAEVYLEAANGAERGTWLECHRHVAEQLLISGYIERGVQALSTLLAETGVHAPATPRGALVSLIRHRLMLRLRGFRFKERDRSEISDAEILRLDVLQIASKGLSVVDTIRGSEFQARLLVHALRTGSRAHVAQAMSLEATYQATLGKAALSRRNFERASALAGAEPDTYMTSLLIGGRGIAAYFDGDAPTSVEMLLEAEALAKQVPGATWEVASMKVFYMFVMRVIGDYRAMRERYRQYAVEAQQRGDRYVESTMRRVCVPMWLADNNPEEAVREIARATWAPPETTGGFHVQHFHELIGRGEIALYTGEPADEAVLKDGMERLSRSFLLRIASIRFQYAYLLGRLALVKSGDLKVIERHARSLAKERNPIASVWAASLRLGAAVRTGDKARAESIVVAAEDVATKAGMKLHAAALRFRLAKMRGDESSLEKAALDMDALGIRAPGKMAGLLIPTGNRDHDT